MVVLHDASAPAVSLVVAVTASANGIGANGGLPWAPKSLRADMAWFKFVTTHAFEVAPEDAQCPLRVAEHSAEVTHCVVMGRKTWQSIPPRFRPLPSRKNVVVSRSTAPNAAISDDACFIDDLAAYVAQNSAQNIAIIGGSEIYRLAVDTLPNLRYLFVTEVADGAAPDVASFACDTFFPLDLAACASKFRKIDISTQVYHMLTDESPSRKFAFDEARACFYEGADASSSLTYKMFLYVAR